ncbi:receptor-like protein, partial [Trifolium medium]|nr:receptor-like protein [Trifolium medium]
MFEGMIPTSNQFGTFGIDSYEGNANLCGFPLSKSCDNDEGQPVPSTSDDEDESIVLNWKAVAT